MRLVFFGSGEFGLPTLAALAARHEVALVVTQPDRPAGRRRQVTPTPIGRWAAEQGLAVIKPPKCNADEVVARVAEAGADANVVVAFGQKIGRTLIDSPGHGAAATMNLHASLLPKYRGAAPINWAIVRGERETGNTVFSLGERMDAGDVLGMQRTTISKRETAGELHDRLAAMGPELVLDVLDRLEAGALSPQPQDESLVTLAPKLSKADAVIDFTRSAEALRCFVHGLTPWPGVTAWWAADETTKPTALMLRRVESLPRFQHAAEPGRVLDDGVVAAGAGAIRLLEVQPPGKRVMSWADYTRGHEGAIGAMFSGDADRA